MFSLPTKNSGGPSTWNAQPDSLKSDSEVYAVLEECRHRSLSVGVILCRQLDEDMCILEAAQAAENAQERRNSDDTRMFNSSVGRSEELNNSQVFGSTDNTDTEKEFSLFIPTVVTDSDNFEPQIEEDVAPAPNAFEYSLGCTVNTWIKNRIDVRFFTPTVSTGCAEKSKEAFPCPRGRWECGTFLGKRVFVEANSSFLGRGSLAVVLGGNLVVTEMADEEKRLCSIPVAIKEILYDARQKALRNALEFALQFRLEVDHPGIVHLFHTGGYYLPFSHLSSVEGVPIFSHLSLACSTTGSIADVLRRRGPFPMPEIQRCMAEVLSTLQFMHEEHHWVHNDIKSHNILIFENPTIFSNYKYQLTDFTGVARAQTFAEVMRDIRNGMHKQLEATTVGGTAAFMSPESCLGLGMLTSNDIWSLGVTAYHMATNTLPWKPLERQFPSMILNGFRCKYSLNTIFGTRTSEAKEASSTSAPCADQNQLNAADKCERNSSLSAGSNGSSSVSSSSFGSSILREKYADFRPILEEFDQTVLTDNFQDFVLQCLIENPLERPTASQLRGHPFVKGILVGTGR